MTTTRRAWNRRQFLGAAATVAAFGPVPWVWATGSDKLQKRRTILSFYCDDTGPYGPYTGGAKAFQTFLDYCAEQGIAGESSLILAADGRSMARGPSDEEQAYLKQVARAWECDIDTHMELMTHWGLFDFNGNRDPPGAVHEGLWLYEPAVSVEHYEGYFQHILAEGEQAGIRFTGLTWPGCGCEICTRRYAELRAQGYTAPNPAVWQALLNLAKQGKFRGRTVPSFWNASETDFHLHQKARDGKHAVYDLMPNAMDFFGTWANDPKKANPDYYITADGKSGIVVRHVEAGFPYCIWYAHWQGLNPGNGVGWAAFTTVVTRIRQHLNDRVVWMRPSDITDHFHEACGWKFLDDAG